MYQLMDKELQALCDRAGIKTVEDLEEKMDGDIYHDLYQYWVCTGLMPYGTAKARDGDPDQWIFDQMEPMLPYRVDITELQ